jgi:hypothetical protein
VGLAALVILPFVKYNNDRVPPLSQSDPSLAVHLRLLGEERSLAEPWVSTVKRDRRIRLGEMQLGESLYKDAKAAVDGLIDQLKWVLHHGTEASGAKQVEDGVRRAIKASRRFTEWARNVHRSRLFGESGVEDFVLAVLEGTNKLVEEWRKADRERREEISKVLDGYRWENFQSIK